MNTSHPHCHLSLSPDQFALFKHYTAMLPSFLTSFMMNERQFDNCEFTELMNAVPSYHLNAVKTFPSMKMCVIDSLLLIYALKGLTSSFCIST